MTNPSVATVPTQQSEKVGDDVATPSPSAANTDSRPSLFGGAKSKASTTDRPIGPRYRAPSKLEHPSSSATTDPTDDSTEEEEEGNPLDDGRYTKAIQKACRNRKEWDAFVPYASYFTRNFALGLVWTNLKEVYQFEGEITEINRKHAEKKLAAEKEDALKLAQEAKEEEC